MITLGGGRRERLKVGVDLRVLQSKRRVSDMKHDGENIRNATPFNLAVRLKSQTSNLPRLKRVIQ